MPDPPSVGLFTRYVLENQIPVAVVLLCLAGGILWRLQGATTVAAQRRHVLLGLGIGLLAAGVFATGLLVTTSGERAEAVARDLVERAVAGDVGGAAALLAPDARLTFDRPTNPGYPRAAIDQRLDGLNGRYAIKDNQITMLDAYTVDADRGVVHLALRTMPESGFGPVFSQWVLDIERQDDGSFAVQRILWVSINGQTPSPEWGR